MKRDVMKLYGVPEDRVKVIYNGIDPDFYAPTFDEKILAKWGVDPKRPFVLFVGRITRQKGISQLIQAIPQIDKSAQVVLCAGAPDTIELADECNATPSLYEPFGIINLEAMSCGTPVVGSAVGGIPEIIVDGETGFLVPLKAKSETDFEPADPKAFQTDFANKLNKVLGNPELAKKMGEVSRKRAIDVFSWKSIAKQTFDFYQECIDRYKKEGKR